jgi:hypothetical protein
LLQIACKQVLLVDTEGVVQALRVVPASALHSLVNDLG